MDGEGVKAAVKPKIFNFKKLLEKYERGSEAKDFLIKKIVGRILWLVI